MPNPVNPRGTTPARPSIIPNIHDRRGSSPTRTPIPSDSPAYAGPLPLPATGPMSTSPSTTRFSDAQLQSWFIKPLSTESSQAEYSQLPPNVKVALRLEARKILNTEPRDNAKVPNAAWLWMSNVVESHQTDAVTAKTLIRDLVKFTEKEQNRALRRQLSICLIQAGLASKKLREEILPSKPPYASILNAHQPDKPLEFFIYSDDDTMKSSKYKETFRAAGAQVKQHNRGLEIDFEVPSESAAEPSTKFKLHVLDSFHTSYRDMHAFRSMNDSSKALEAYNFHSQYGTALDPSIAETTGNADVEKLYVMAACRSKVFADRVQSLFPKTQFIWTDNAERVSDTPKMLVALLTGIAKRENWDQIRQRILNSNIYHRKGYVLPDDIKKLSFVDSDHDGIADHVDQLLSPNLKKIASEETLKPRHQSTEPRLLDGTKAHHAIQLAKGLLGYVGFTVSQENQFEGRGWTESNVNGPLLSVKPKQDGNAYQIKINAAYSHVSEQALAIAITNELFRFIGTTGQRSMAWLSTRQKQVAAFATGVQLMDAWGRRDLYAEYAQRYQLPRPLSYAQVVSLIDQHHGVSGPTVKKLDQLMNRQGNQ